MTNGARPPLTSTEKEAIYGLAETLKKTDSQFFCGGTIRLPSSKKLRLFYCAGPEDEAQCLDLSQTIPQGISKLLDACVPSAHGRGSESVYDESYRLARELCRDRFALNMDILSGSGVLNDIAALTSPRNSGSELEVELYKLNTYYKDGFFKPHRDTPKSDRHLGTIVVALPIAFEGGALRVSHGNKDIFFDWGATATESQLGQETALPWAFLFSDLEHEVLPVTSGTRVTLAYDVFASEPSISRSFTMDGTKLPLVPDIDAILENKDFLPGGGKLAIAMSHAYPIHSGLSDSNYITTGFAGRLKGLDAILYRALTSAGITVNIRAVYNPEYYMDDLSDDRKDDDGFGPIAFDEKENFCYFLHTSERFISQDYSGGKWSTCWEDTQNKLIAEFYEAEVEDDLIWVVRPSIESYSKMGSYVAYGNEPSLDAVYAAAAFVLDIPAIGNGPRATK